MNFKIMGNNGAPSQNTYKLHKCMHLKTIARGPHESWGPEEILPLSLPSRRACLRAQNSDFIIFYIHVSYTIKRGVSPPECYNALSGIVRKPRKTTSKFHRIINAASVL